MLLSKACDYGLRAVLYIASKKESEYLSIRDISDELDISFHFLTKILQILTQKSLLLSFKGPKGGVKLAKPANEITLMEVIVAIDGPDLFHECVLGLNGCGEKRPCPMHEQWGPIRDQLGTLFNRETLASMSSKLESMDYRLTDLVD